MTYVSPVAVTVEADRLVITLQVQSSEQAKSILLPSHENICDAK